MVVLEKPSEAQDEFGHLYGSTTYYLTKEDIEALLNGKQLATTVNDEYSIFIVYDNEEEED